MRAAWIPDICRHGPLFWPVLRAASVLESHADWPPVEAYDELVPANGGVRFRLDHRPRRRVAKTTAAPERSYDARICEERVVPTRRCNWHDYFNALVWSTFARAKPALHERQYRAVRARSAADDADMGRRSREQDALALVDEGGVVLLCEQRELANVRGALERRASEEIAEVVARGRALGVIYGHAVYEHLARGAPPVRAMVHLALCTSIPDGAAACVELADAELARALGDASVFLDPAGFRSLPVEVRFLGARPARAV